MLKRAPHGNIFHNKFRYCRWRCTGPNAEIMELTLKAIIQNEVESVFGRRIITSRDCIELSDEIFNKTKLRLNPNTLRRYFGLVKADYPPSKSTLSILATYCGFHSLEEARQAGRGPKDDGAVQSHEGILYHLISLFRDIPVNNVQDSTFFYVVKHVIKFLNKNASMADKFQNMVAKTQSGLDYYFEKMANVDRLNGYFGAGLRYYRQEKASAEGNIFVESLQIFRYWLSKDKVSLTESAMRMLAVERPEFTDPFIAARYYAGLLYSYAVTGMQADKIRYDMLKHHTALTNRCDAEAYLFFNYTVAEACVFTGFYEDALYYVSCYMEASGGNVQRSTSTYHYFNNVKLVECLALHKSGEDKKAALLIKQIKPSEFCFLNRNLSMIIYLGLLRQYMLRGEKYSEQVAELIAETGFLRLEFLVEPGAAARLSRA